MPRLMSVAYTADAVIERRKTVTRRKGWQFLKPGDRLTLCRKVQGRRKGEPLDRLAEVEVVSVRREQLRRMSDDLDYGCAEPMPTVTAEQIAAIQWHAPTEDQMKRLALAVGFVAVILAANWLTSTFHLVTILSLTAPAGTWVAGFAFVFRDWLQEAGGRRWVAGAILAGTVASVAVSPTLALASGAAFLVSELADWAVYTPLRKRHPLAAAILSNTVGALVDSVIFLSLAGFPLSGLWTQVVVKVGTTTLIVLGVRLAVSRQSLHADGGGRHA